MVTAAHRYCLGRRSYMVSDCVDWLIYHWHEFDEHARLRVINETKEALEKGWAGDDCDIKEWKRLIEKTI